MDKDFFDGASTFLSERQSNLMVLFRKHNKKHVALLKKKKTIISLLRDILPASDASLLDALDDLIETQTYVESSYLYDKGIKDCITLSSFLDTEFIDSCYPSDLFDDQTDEEREK